MSDCKNKYPPDAFVRAKIYLAATNRYAVRLSNGHISDIKICHRSNHSVIFPDSEMFLEMNNSKNKIRVFEILDEICSAAEDQMLFITKHHQNT